MVVIQPTLPLEFKYRIGLVADFKQTNKFDTHKEMEIVLEVIFDLEWKGSSSNLFDRGPWYVGTDNDFDVSIGPYGSIVTETT